MKRSILIAVVLAAAAAGWILSGQFGGEAGQTDRTAPAATGETREPELPSVRAALIHPTQRPRAIVVNGRAEASRSVELKAEIQGAIVKVGADEGAPVAKGDVIAQIATRDRKARLDESKALLRQRQLEYKAARQLSKKGFRSETSVAQARANLDAAEAQLRRMEVEMDQTTLTAPFDGVLDTRDVEIGSYVKEGDRIATVVDLDPALIVAYVSERDIAQVSVGQPGTATLLGGATVSGTVRYVSTVADAATRSFKVELEVPNPDGVVRDGLTAQLVLPLKPIEAYRVTPAVLTLSDDGRVGIKVVDDAEIVRFVPVRILADAADGIWIAGLPGDPRLITVGHEYVKEGQRVTVVADAGRPAS